MTAVRSVFLCIVLGLAGCGAPYVKVGVSSTANLNLSGEQEPLPVVVRVYQLADSQRFEAAAFDDLWKNDVAALGDSLVLKEELIMDPAFQRRIEMPRHDQARYVAAVAIFRQPDDEGWRAITALPMGYFSRRLDASVRVMLKGNTVVIDD